MSRGRGGAIPSRAAKINYSTRNAYKSYDWRPRGRDGESNKPADRASCNPTDMFSRRASPRCGTHLDMHPAGISSSYYKSFTTRPGRTAHSPLSFHTSKFLPGFSCDFRQCDASEKFLSRVSSPHDVHRHSKKCICSASRDKSRLDPIPQSESSDDIIFLRHNCVAPGMEPAGVITRKFEYPFPPEMHSIVRLDSYVKYQGVYKGLGQIVKETFKPRAGDVIIVKMPRIHPNKDHGYVEFVTKKHEECHFCPGDLLLRVGKFVQNNYWRYSKRYKLYQQTDDHHWLFIGMVDNFVNLLPVTNHGINTAHIDKHCRFFFPRRGDLMVHLQPPDMASQLEWFNPKTNICKGDILVRMYLGDLSSHVDPNQISEAVEASVEIFLYSGKGMGWIFMGRDDCLYNNEHDLLDQVAVT